MSAVGEIVITQQGDIVTILRAMREAAADLGFGVTESTEIVTAASELARNVYRYAHQGVMRWRRVEREGMSGLELRFEDNGPGIADVKLALQKGYTTGDGLGMGLPGVQCLMDELDIQTAVGKGATVTVRKWKRS
jgi:serine/threonine-protein kinase RsbT